MTDHDPTGWLTPRDLNAHECELPVRPPLFTDVRKGDSWRCSCGTLYVLVGLDPLPLRWRPVPHAPRPDGPLSPLHPRTLDPTGHGPCPDDHGNEPTPWADRIFIAALFLCPLVVLTVLVVTS